MATVRAIPAPDHDGEPRRPGLLLRLLGARAGAVVLAAVATAAGWRPHAALPGLAGAAMVSCGAGGMVTALAGALGVHFGAWPAVLAGGVFLLRIDGRVGGA
jgi:hypothetical protein